MLLAGAGNAQDAGNPQDSAKPDSQAAGQAIPQDSAKPKKSKEKPYALLAGTVWTADGHPIAGAKVFVRRVQDKRPRWTTVSDERGEIWVRVPPGKQDYVIWAEVMKGKKDKVQVDTTVHVDNDERVDFGLHLKSSSESGS